MEVNDKRAHLRIDILEVNHARLEKALAENTNLTKTIADNTSELVELVRGVKGFRSLVLWVTPMIAAGLAVMAYMEGFK